VGVAAVFDVMAHLNEGLLVVVVLEQQQQQWPQRVKGNEYDSGHLLHSGFY